MKFTVIARLRHQRLLTPASRKVVERPKVCGVVPKLLLLETVGFRVYFFVGPFPTAGTGLGFFG